MKRSEATNTFDLGLLMDLNPMVTPNNVLTNCLNGTLITYNGNEHVLLNDMGNGRVETAFLPEGYVPLGTAELGGIIYIVSYNPLIDKCLIGCFPSPERNITSDEILTPGVSIDNSLFQKDGKILSTIVKVKLLSDPNSEDGLFKLNPGDKYTIYSTNNGVTNNKATISDVNTGITKVDATPRYVTIHVVSIGEDGKITYLDDYLKWDSPLQYYIKEATGESAILNDIDTYRTLVSSAYNIFNSKVSGELALLFELKVIDSFSVTWDAEVKDNTGEYDKEAEVKFKLGWTSSNTTINPKYVKLTESEISQLLTTVKKNDICTLVDYSNRVNDGSDEYVDVIAGKFLYKSKDTLSNYVWNYTLTPAMKFGELDYLSVKGTINFAEIGSGKISVDEWRYYIQENSFYLNWGLDAYPEKNKKINRVILTFIPFDKVSSSTVIVDKTKQFGTSYPQYIISGKSSYSGNFQEVIKFNDLSKVVNKEILRDNLYLVDICAEYGNSANGNTSWEYRHNYKWLYTTGLWNEEFFDENITDFSTLSLTNSIDFKPQFIKTDKIYGNELKTTLTLPDTLEDSLTAELLAYKAMGSRIVTVSYNSDTKKFDRTSENASVKIEVIPTDYEELFTIKLLSSDKFTNSIDKKEIVCGNMQIESDLLSTISNYVESIIMDDTHSYNETALAGVIGTILDDGISDSTENAKAIDSFDAKILSGADKDTISLNVCGSIFSRINSDLKMSSVEVGQRVRPLLYLTDDYNQLGLEEYSSQPRLKYYFTENHWDDGGGKPFVFLFGRYTYSGSEVNKEQSNKKYWNPSDSFSRNTYWDDTKPYTEWLNPWMNESNGPFQVLKFLGDVKGYSKALLKNKFYIWVRTDNGHFIPINATGSQSDLNNKIILFLLLVYYVDKEVSPLEKCVVKAINRLATFTETWNVIIKSSLKVYNMKKTLNLKVPDTKIVIPLDTLITRSLAVVDNGSQVIDVTNLLHYGTNLDLGTETFSHTFKVNSDDLYVEYEEAKSTSIPALYDISTKEKSVIGKALNANKLYVYDNNGLAGFLPANESSSKYISSTGTYTEKSIDGASGEKKVFLSRTTTSYKTTKLLNMMSIKDGELYFSEDSLLSKKADFYYDTGDEGATYKSNSTVTFI